MSHAIQRHTPADAATQRAWAVGSTPASAQPTLVPTAPAPDASGVRIGSYRLVRELGAGGCGSVWLAEHEVIGSKVAIKILRPEVVNVPGVQERFITEARASSTIPSPHVARYVDLGQLPSGEPYAIMEYLEGETLHGRIERERQLSVADALEVTRQAAETLALAHDASIIHRDIKPENIFLTGGDARIHIKLLDFGIAKLIGDAMQSAHQTAAGLFVGTPAYCAPEQICASSTTTAVDMYALGTTLYEMLTGRLPFDTSAADFLAKKMGDVAPRVSARRPDVPPRLDALVAAMLARNPADRPASMRVLLDELAHVYEPLPVTVATTQELVAVVSHAPRGRKIAIVVTLAVATLAAIVIAFAASANRKHAPLPPSAVVAPPPSARAPAMTATPIETPAPAAEPAIAPPAPKTIAPPSVTRKPARARKRAATTHDTATTDVITADPFE